MHPQCRQPLPKRRQDAEATPDEAAAADPAPEAPASAPEGGEAEQAAGA